MSVLYNDNEKFAAAVLRRAIHAGIVAPGSLRLYGNAIVVPQAAEIIKVCMEYLRLNRGWVF